MPSNAFFGWRGIAYLSLAATLILGIPSVSWAQFFIKAPRDSADFVHYSAVACAAAAERAHQLQFRTRSDTLVGDRTVKSDTQATVSRAIAKACVAHLQIATVPMRYLPALASAYLAYGNDAAAREAMDWRMKAESAQPVATQAASLVQFADAFAKARPLRLTAMQEIAGRICKLGPKASSECLRAYFSPFMRVLTMQDHKSIIEAAKRILVALQGVPPEEFARDRENYMSIGGFSYMMIANSTAALYGRDSAKKVVGELRVTAKQLGATPAMMDEIQQLDNSYDMFDREAPLLAAGYWRGAEGDTVRPVAGKVSLILFRPLRDAMPIVNRLHAKYGDALQITIVDQLQGYFSNVGPLTPNAEADSIARYYRGELGAPAAVLVNATPVGKRPDGRVVRGPSENNRIFAGMQFVLIDKTKRMRWLSASNVPDETTMDRIIAQLM